MRLSLLGRRGKRKKSEGQPKSQDFHLLLLAWDGCQLRHHNEMWIPQTLLSFHSWMPFSLQSDRTTQGQAIQREMQRETARSSVGWCHQSRTALLAARIWNPSFPLHFQGILGHSSAAWKMNVTMGRRIRIWLSWSHKQTIGCVNGLLTKKSMGSRHTGDV